MRNIKLIVLFSSITMFLIVMVYFFQFNGKLSDSKTDWGTFGDYLSGVFSMFNLAVVILLAFYVKMSEDERRKEDLKFQRERHIAENNFNQYKLDKEIETQKIILKADIEYKKKVALLELNFYYLKSFEKSFDKLICTNYKDKLECMLNTNAVTINLINMTTMFDIKQLPYLMGDETPKLIACLEEMRLAVSESSENDFYGIFSNHAVIATDLKLNYVRKIRDSFLKTFDIVVQ